MNKRTTLLLMMACASSNCMQRPGGQSLEVNDLLSRLLNATRPSPASSTIAGRPFLSLLEAQMKGNFKAVEEHGETKLQFPDYDSKTGKIYGCKLANANRTIDAVIAPYYAIFKTVQNDLPSALESLPIAHLVEKFKEDPFAEPEEAELRNTQISRFILFFMNNDLQAHLKSYKNGKANCIGLNEINQRKSAVKKMKDEINSIIFNRLSLRSALASGDVAAINERTKYTLTLSPVPPLHELIIGLRRKAYAAAAGQH